MKPAPFAYRRAASAEEACDVLANHGPEVAVLAGGQSLILRLNRRELRPGIVLDVNPLEELAGTVVLDDEVRLGALVRASELERSERLRSTVPVLGTAMRHLAYPQIRARTTVGGSLANADPAAELVVLLAAMDGWVGLRSDGVERTVGWREFFTGRHTTSRRPDELLVSAGLRPAGMRYAFEEISAKPGGYAIVSACVGARIEDGVIGDIRIVLGGVADRPVRCDDAEHVARGQRWDERLLPRVRAAVRDCLDPEDDVSAPGSYRKHVGGTLAGRALARLVPGRAERG